PVGNRSCVFYETPHNLQGSMRHQGRLLAGAEHGTILCHSSHCCFGIWNQSHGRLQAVMQGCWGSDRDGCDSPACKTSPVHTAGVIFQRCLCRSDFCNANVSQLGAPAAPQGEVSPGNGGPRVGLVLCSPLHPRELRGCPCPTPVPGQPGGSSECHPSCLCPPQVLQDGRFSVVWQGTLHQTPVAIKAFPDACSQHFAAEWSVHSLPLMNHDNVARLLAAGRGGVRGEQGSLLVLQLYPAVSAHPAASPGHGGVGDATALLPVHGQGGDFAPGFCLVAHRDLSSQNVLVREDQSCAIGDFGLATALPACLEQWGGGRMEAGTQRYMAPEILDDSLDLQVWGRALKQADIYSLALVLWEILSRCSGLSPGERL
uniref:receptor protein serine/threonine kinase n=1 Tax=Terrapene triunguis TaxID=2587831 RepID=A0A674ID21_9SAUR